MNFWWHICWCLYPKSIHWHFLLYRDCQVWGSSSCRVTSITFSQSVYVLAPVILNLFCGLNIEPRSADSKKIIDISFLIINAAVNFYYIWFLANTFSLFFLWKLRLIGSSWPRLLLFQLLNVYLQNFFQKDPYCRRACCFARNIYWSLCCEMTWQWWLCYLLRKKCPTCHKCSSLWCKQHFNE